MQEKIEKLNQKIDALQEKTAKNAALIDEKRNATKEQIESEIDTARENVASAKERAKANTENLKTAAAEEISKFQASIDAAKQKIADKKEARDQKKLERYIEDTLDYADSCVELAMVASEEAKLAVLEAVAAQIEYDETYGA